MNDIAILKMAAVKSQLLVKTSFTLLYNRHEHYLDLKNACLDILGFIGDLIYFGKFFALMFTKVIL